MELKEKDLLLKDLCARLPYGVIVDIDRYHIGKLRGIEGDVVSTDRGINYPLRLVKPYLRPMSSMTEEEKVEYGDRCYFTLDCINKNQQYYFNELYDWLNRKMFDYRGLIPLDLALEAPEGMYKEGE